MYKVKSEEWMAKFSCTTNSERLRNLVKTSPHFSAFLAAR